MSTSNKIISKINSKTINNLKMPLTKDGNKDNRYSDPQFVKKDGTRDNRCNLISKIRSTK